MGSVPTISRLAWLGWAVLYALAVLYVSTVVSVQGFHPFHYSWAEGWQRFLATRYVNVGSDQRADWTANLLMIVPLGFMLAGGLWPRHSRVWLVPSAVAAFVLTVAYVLAVKFIQVWFPRTVTINYIIAQTSGAALGVLAYGVGHAWLGRVMRQSPTVQQDEVPRHPRSLMYRPRHVGLARACIRSDECRRCRLRRLRLCVMHGVRDIGAQRTHVSPPPFRPMADHSLIRARSS